MLSPVRMNVTSWGKSSNRGKPVAQSWGGSSERRVAHNTIKKEENRAIVQLQKPRKRLIFVFLDIFIYVHNVF